MVFYACDISPKAIARVKENSAFREEFATAFVCDVAHKDALIEALHTAPRPTRLQSPSGECTSPPVFDIVTLIFVLSAIHPSQFHICLCNAAQ